MTCLPTPTLPVKLIAAASGCVSMASPISEASPVMRLTTPGGSISAIIATVCAGAMADCCGSLMTTVLPASSACGSLAPRIDSGQFHGTMSSATPRGLRAMTVSNGGPDRRSSAISRGALSATSVNREPRRPISVAASFSTLPCSRVNRRVRRSRSAASAVRCSATRRSSAARSAGLRADQAGKARCAAWNARSTSSTEASAAWPTRSAGRAGLWIG